MSRVEHDTMTAERRAAARLAWGLWIVGMVLALGSLLLAFLALPYPDSAESVPLLFRLLLYLPSILAWTSAGALIASRQPRNPIGWLLLTSGLLNLVGAVAEGYWRYALFVQPNAFPAGQVMLWVGTRPYELSLTVDMLLILLFPTGRALSRRWSFAGWAIVLGAIIRFIAVTLTPGPLDASVAIENPIGLVGATALLQGAASLGNALQVGGGLAAAASLIVRLRRARGIERQQIKLLVYTLTLYMMSNVALAAQIQAPGEAISTLTNVLSVVQAGTGVLVASAIAIAILRDHLFDIDILINRTLVYLSLTGALLLVYFGSVALLQSLFRALTGQASVFAIIGSTLAIAALFQPLRWRIQRGIDRLFYRQRVDPALILANHAAIVRAEVDPERLTAALIQAADETMQPAHASLWLRKADAFTRTGDRMGRLADR